MSEEPRRKDDREGTMKRRAVWEWVAPLVAALAAGVLVEGAHLIPDWAWWSRGPLAFLGWTVVWIWYSTMWRRWRSAEIDCIDRRRLGPPRITLIAGHDLHTGEACVVTDRGFVVAPDKTTAPGGTLPPPVDPACVTARRRST
jgi:hypothetical protein